MDVHCSTCAEPWDVYHLWHEAIFETHLSAEEVEAWRKLPRSEKLSVRYRTEFGAVGWEFGKSIINVVHCPCCPPGAQPNADRKAIKAALEELLGADEDGIAATFEDYNL